MKNPKEINAIVAEFQVFWTGWDNHVLLAFDLFALSLDVVNTVSPRLKTKPEEMVTTVTLNSFISMKREENILEIGILASFSDFNFKISRPHSRDKVAGLIDSRPRHKISALTKSKKNVFQEKWKRHKTVFPPIWLVVENFAGAGINDRNLKLIDTASIPSTAQKFGRRRVISRVATGVKITTNSGRYWPISQEWRLRVVLHWNWWVSFFICKYCLKHSTEEFCLWQ